MTERDERIAELELEAECWKMWRNESAELRAEYMKANAGLKEISLAAKVAAHLEMIGMGFTVEETEEKT